MDYLLSGLGGVAAFLAAVIIQAAAHWVAARLVGGRMDGLVFAPRRTDSSPFRLGETLVLIDQFPASVCPDVAIPSARAYRTRCLGVLLAGPLCNVAIALAIYGQMDRPLREHPFETKVLIGTVLCVAVALIPWPFCSTNVGKAILRTLSIRREWIPFCSLHDRAGDEILSSIGAADYLREVDAALGEQPTAGPLHFLRFYPMWVLQSAEAAVIDGETICAHCADDQAWLDSACTMLAWCYLWTSLDDRFERARRRLDFVSDEEGVEAVRVRSVLASQEGQHVEAIAMLQACTRFSGGKRQRALTHALLALAHWNAGEREAANTEAESCLALTSDCPLETHVRIVLAGRCFAWDPVRR